MRNLYFVISLFLLIASGSDSRTQTTLTLTRGWGGKDRAGRWNTILVRAADPVPRNVTLQILGPQPGGFATILEERIAIGPAPATFELLAPTHDSPWERTVVVLRDAETGKFLAQFPPATTRPSRPTTPEVPEVGAHTIFVGMTGVAASLDRPAPYLSAQFSFLPAHLLPRTPLGYDALEILFLNRANLRAIDPEQQQAILDWIRAGGALLVSPGDDSIPPDAPLVKALPCAIGEVRPIDLAPQTLESAHLPDRFARTAGRTLTPVADARPLVFFGEANLTGYSKRLGLGLVLVVPLDVAGMQFEETDEPVAVPRFWQPILKTLFGQPKPIEQAKFASPYHGLVSESPDQFREGAASATLCDFLAPPGRAPRTWPRVVLILLGICFIVGPVDFFALRMARQSPWTMTTALGWIAMVTLGVVYLGAREPTVATNFAAVRLVDQVDDARVATTELVALDGASQRVHIDPADPAGWWEPVVPGSTDVKSPGTQSDLAFHLSDAGCVPEAFWSAPRQPRFFRRQNIQPGAAIVDVKLAITAEASAARITGTIRNVSNFALKDVRIRTARGVAELKSATGEVIAAGQQVTVDLAAAGGAFSPTQFASRYQNFGYYGARTTSEPIREGDLWAVVPDLAARRSIQIDTLLENDSGLACVYALCVDPAPAAQLEGAPPTPARQYEWVRALTRLAR